MALEDASESEKGKLIKTSFMSCEIKFNLYPHTVYVLSICLAACLVQYTAILYTAHLWISSSALHRLSCLKLGNRAGLQVVCWFMFEQLKDQLCLWILKSFRPVSLFFAFFIFITELIKAWPRLVHVLTGTWQSHAPRPVFKMNRSCDHRGAALLLLGPVSWAQLYEVPQLQHYILHILQCCTWELKWEKTKHLLIHLFIT